MPSHRESVLLAVTKARIEKEPMVLVFYPICERDESDNLTWANDADVEWTMFGFQNIKAHDVAEWLRYIADTFEENYGPEDTF